MSARESPALRVLGASAVNHLGLWRGPGLAPLLPLAAALGCGGHQVSSWAPSGSLDWEGAAPPADAGPAAPGAGAQEPSRGGRPSTYVFDDAVAGDLVRPAGAAPEILPSDEAAGMLARAEDFFAQGEMENAVRAYAAVADSGDRRYAPYASYKLAWCYGNLQEHVNALQRMTDVLRMIDPPQDEQERRLRREAVRDLAFFFAQVARPEQAAAFFRRVMRPEEVREALERLAETYRDEGRGRDEADVREQLRLLDL